VTRPVDLDGKLKPDHHRFDDGTSRHGGALTHSRKRILMTNDEERRAVIKVILKAVVGSVAAVLIVVGLVMWGHPHYNVWQQHMEGKAELAKATYNRQIAVQEAHAKMEAAKSLAEAEVERAKGVAQANQIIGDSLKGNESYLRYLWIESMSHDDHTVVYVPTEAGLPILEAARKTDRPAPRP
jgi:hypothetical protein